MSCLFYASYDYNIDATYYLGSRTGTQFGTGATATITGGKLDCTGPASKAVQYAGSGNADFTQQFTIEFDYTPNYNGAPAAAKTLFSVTVGTGSLANAVYITHNNTTGSLSLNIKNSAAGSIVGASLGNWTTNVAGTKYRFSLNADITAGATRLFLEQATGVMSQWGSTQTGTGTRTAASYLNVGLGYDGLGTADGYFDNFAVYNEVLHTTGWNIQPAVTLPRETMIEGFCYQYGSGTPLANQIIKIRPYQKGFVIPVNPGYGTFHPYNWNTVATTTASGYFSCIIFIPSTGNYWEWKMGSQRYYGSDNSQLATYPVDFSDLTLVKIED